MSAGKLRALYNSGRTYDEIAIANERSEGWRPDRSTVKRKLEAMGLGPRRPTHRDLLPWTIRPEHNRSLFRHMLQAESRKRAGRKLSPVDRKLLARLDELLHGRGKLLVVGYHPDIKSGFYLAERDDADTDIIRAPEHRDGAALDLDLGDEELAAEALRRGLEPAQLLEVGRDRAAGLLRAARAEVIENREAKNPTAS